MAVALMDKAAGQAKLPETPAVVALFAFGSRLDRDTMQLFARTHSEEVRAAAIASTAGRRYWSCCTAAFARRCWCWMRCSQSLP